MDKYVVLPLSSWLTGKGLMQSSFRMLDQDEIGSGESGTIIRLQTTHFHDNNYLDPVASTRNTKVVGSPVLRGWVIPASK
jgi:hypothetical protein